MKSTKEISESEDKIKASLLKYHTSNKISNNRIDISKVVEDYQNKF